jgi:hypothetical protein
MKIYSQVRLGVTPEINAVCTLLIGAVTIGVVASHRCSTSGAKSCVCAMSGPPADQFTITDPMPRAQLRGGRSR